MKKKYRVITREYRNAEYIVEASTFKRAGDLVYEGEGEPLKFYNEEVEVIDIFEVVENQ